MVAEVTAIVTAMTVPLLAFAAALVMGASAIGAGYAIGVVGSAAAGAVAEKPEVSSKLLLYVALAEAIAIYGLVVALMILFSA